MVVAFEDNAPTLLTVQKWAVDFKKGKESLDDDLRFGYRATATTEEILDCIHHMLVDDRRLSIIQIASAISKSCERVENTLHNELSMTKVSAQWGARCLTPDQERTRLITTQQNLILFEAEPASLNQLL
ncbi:uncharacterized protein LOC106881262 [Octopus bimaculoides]|uniref:uncharacterized protein LOC106881262 n=1 Tax=Octopus bimaculoides TaxID=37653 RepID=UPI00071E3E46|nr:uncharacterized protein LOC106881262 [Octopus bimaculoides]|eukprot:XP_014787070.1 PREDICTED: uncharacterized protein LOC106881262 [Octopus bimaculoides]